MYEFDLPVEYDLSFSASGRDLKKGIATKLDKLKEDIAHQYAKARKLIQHPQVEEILENPDETYQLYPTKAPDDSDSDEPWKNSGVSEEEYQQKLRDVQIAEKYHELVEKAKILETIERNLDPNQSYDLTTSQLLLFGL